MYEAPVRCSPGPESEPFRTSWRPLSFRANRLLRTVCDPLRRAQRRASLLLGCSLVLGVSGCGVVEPSGILTANPATVSFGSVTVGQMASATVSFTNSGTGAIQISQLSVVGQPFTITDPPSPVMVAAGGSYSLGVQFNPAAAGAATGQLIVTSDATSGGQVVVNLNGTGMPAAPPVTISGLSCASESVTGSATDACTVTLSGPAASGGANVSLTSSSAAVTVPATVTVPANATSAEFAASVTAVSAAQTVTLAASYDESSANYAVQLNAAVRSLRISTKVLAFGNVTIGTATTQSLTLTSTGTEPVTLSEAVLSGDGYTMSGLVAPVTLNPGQEIVVQVQFDPTAAGAEFGQLTIDSNSSTGDAAIIRLTATGVDPSQPQGALRGFSCNIASWSGAGTDTCIITLSAAASTGGLTVSVASSSSAVTVPATVTVAAGATSAGFTASVAAVSSTQTAMLTASAGGVTETYTLQLNGSGPALTVGATNIAFGSVNLNSPATQVVMLTSSGTSALTINAATLVGTGFTLSGASFPVTLNPGQEVTLDLAFDPTVAGAATGSLTITSNAASSGTVTISLSGTGQDATQHTVDLSWDAPVDSPDAVAGYNVYRAPSGTTLFELINTSITLPITYTDNTVVSGTNYDYEVMSVDASGNESAPSNIYTADIP